MKKTFLIISVFISLSGISFIFYRLHSALRETGIRELPEMPPNLRSQTTPEEIFVSPAVPILMYHHISEYRNDGNPSIYVSPKSFEIQIDWLASHGFRTVGPDYFRNPVKLSGKPLVLTFDDGYQDAYTLVFPLLKKYGFRATFYIVTNDMDKPGFLSRDEIVEMAAAGMNFGSHSLSHPDLTRLFRYQAEQEIYGSKKILEEAIGTTVTDFCYPGGINNREIETIVANSGYTTATTVVSDVVSGKTDPFRLNRLNIGDETRFDDLPALTNL